MKEQFIAHWGKIFFALSIVFVGISAQQAGAYSRDVKAAIDRSDEAMLTVQPQLEVGVDRLSNFTKENSPFLKVKNYYDQSKTDGTYKLEIKANRSIESWDTVKDKPYELLMGTDKTITINAKSKYLKDLTAQGIKITVQDFYEEAIEIEIVGKNKIKIKGINSTNENHVQILVENENYGDYAKFHVLVERQIQFYYYVPKESMKFTYNSQILDTTQVTWGKALVSANNPEYIKVKSYTLSRREVAPGQNANAIAFKEVKTWEANTCPFTYEDKTLKPLHTYQYKIKVNIWHTPDPISGEAPINENAAYDAVVPVTERSKWLISKTSDYEYAASKPLTIGKGKLLIGFTRAKNDGLGGFDAEMVMKRWDNGQWIAGMITVPQVKPLLAGDVKMYPDKKDDIKKQIKDKKVFPLEGIYKGKIGGKIMPPLKFDVDNYVIYRMRQHDEGDVFSRLMLEEKAIDTLSGHMMFEKKELDAFYAALAAKQKLPEVKFTKKCSSFWLVDKTDPYFKDKAIYPKSIKIYFTNSETNKNFRKTLKDINAKADATKVTQP